MADGADLRPTNHKFSGSAPEHPLAAGALQVSVKAVSCAELLARLCLSCVSRVRIEIFPLAEDNIMSFWLIILRKKKTAVSVYLSYFSVFFLSFSCLPLVHSQLMPRKLPPDFSFVRVFHSYKELSL